MSLKSSYKSTLIYLGESSGNCSDVDPLPDYLLLLLAAAFLHYVQFTISLAGKYCTLGPMEKQRFA